MVLNLAHYGLRDAVGDEGDEIGGKLVVAACAHCDGGLEGGVCGAGCAVVVEDRADGFAGSGDLIAATAAGGDAEPVVVDGLVGGDDYIVSLTDLQGQLVCDVGLDGHEVGGEDCEWVAVHGDTEGAVYGRVDEADAVLLSFYYIDPGVFPVVVCGVDVGAVDEDVVRRGGSTLRVLSNLVQCESGYVVPVSDGESTEVDVIVGSSWSIDDHGTNNTVTILG